MPRFALRSVSAFARHAGPVGPPESPGGARFALILLVLLLLPGIGLAQTPNTGQAPDPGAASRSAAAESQPRGSFGETIEVRLMDVEVVVTDRQGRRVTGLTEDDFRLYVGDREMPIAFFDEVREGRYVPGPIAVEGGEPELLEMEPVETSYLIFLDDYFTRPPYRNLVLDGFQDDLERVGPRDRFAVVAYDGRRLEVLTDWTQDRTELRAALDAAEDRDGWKAFLEQQRVREASPEARAKLLADQLGRTYQALATALRTFADVPGRRVALVVAGGWPYELVDLDADLALSRSQLFQRRRPLSVVADVANATGFTLYPIDAPGPESAGGGNPADLRASPTEGGRGFQEAVAGESQEYSLLRLAQWTGGEALLDGQRNNALAPVVEDTRSYYWLSFEYPRQGDGARRSVRVETVRDDLEVRARGSFVDLSRGAEAEMKAERAILLGDAGANTLQIQLGEAERQGRRVVLPFSVYIPLDQVRLKPQRGGGALAELELRVAVEDDRGDRTDISAERLKLPLSQGMVDQGTVIYDSAVKLRRREHILVFVLTDPALGTTLVHRLEWDPSR